ncbi:triphosphoribosyl-dephospho-CoA synthase [Clostridium minihomine]|uniref:triphosphoribosyl-dephospho-CoA synthase n=1 Tax=Clostridium minihomine TaxID=2045012 RepID=UPI000C791482|nr:triphosphoribosyl-dephospho-CoA synthase [Clostridium minihomine]
MIRHSRPEGRRKKSRSLQTARQEYCSRISQIAVKALLYEVCIAPKPGLVDRLNNGAHQDMDIYTFLDSACALSGYFREITEQGIRLQRVSPEHLLPYLQRFGVLAEQEMFRATGEVNTHKGIVFSMGILCAAAGHLYGKTRRVSIAELLRVCGEIAGQARPAEEREKTAATNGERLYQKYKIEGVRGEVFREFPSVRLHGFPAFCRAMKKGWDINSAGVYALFHIMAHLEDTNLISRSSLETQMQIQKKLCEILQDDSLSPQEVLHQAEEMDKEFIRLNISPGGAADMLSITLMIWFLQKELPEYFGEFD